MKKGLIISLMLVLSCNKNLKTNTYFISGKVKNLEDNSKVYLKNADTDTIKDSTVIESSRFSFKGSVPYPMRYKLVYKNNHQIKEHSLWLENLPIEISYDFLNPEKLKILAGKEQEIDANLEKEISFFNQEYIRLTKEGKRDSIPLLIDKLTKTIEAFCYKNINSYLAIELLYSIRTKINKDTLCKKINEAEKVIYKSNYGKSLEVFCNTKTPELNDNYIDFQVNTLKGNSISISSLIDEGKPILLVFGGLKCMEEKGRTLLKKFHEENKNNINTIVFSFTNTQEQWLQDSNYNIGDVNLVSDLKGDHSPVKIKYNVQVTPTVYVINKFGKISLISLGFGENVTEHILKFLKK